MIQTAIEPGKTRRFRHAELLEYRACLPVPDPYEGFHHWCKNYAYVLDMQKKKIVPFVWFEGQEIVARDLVDGSWLLILKGRQLGVTWLIAAYVLWRVTVYKVMVCAVVFHEKQYAEDFIGRIKFIWERLPHWCQKAITVDNKQRLAFEHDGNRGEIRAVVGSKNAARSMTGDVVIIDEAGYVRELGKTMQAVQPVIEVSGGQIVQLSSSAGPQGPFYDIWRETFGEYGELVQSDGVGPSGFKPLFLHYSMRPGRGGDWYKNEKARMDKISPVAMKQEHPETPQEAWEYAEGRVYAGFHREVHVGDIAIPTTAELYRAIDWGQSKSPHVVLWVAHIPGVPALLVSPKCPETIREMFAYRWDEDKPEDPLKEDDHTCDALRYAVMKFRLTGTVYVYREWYVKDSVAKGWSPMKEVVKIHEMSGWVQDPDSGGWQVGRDGEVYEGTVADRSWGKMIAMYNEHDMGVVPNPPIQSRKGIADKTQTDKPLTEVKEGIRVISALIDADVPLEHYTEVSRETLGIRALREDAVIHGRGTTGLERRSLKEAARRMLDGQRKGKYLRR